MYNPLSLFAGVQSDGADAITVIEIEKDKSHLRVAGAPSICVNAHRCLYHLQDQNEKQICYIADDLAFARSYASPVEVTISSSCDVQVNFESNFLGAISCI